jgi:hypothetical protein
MMKKEVMVSQRLCGSARDALLLVFIRQYHSRYP